MNLNKKGSNQFLAKFKFPPNVYRLTQTALSISLLRILQNALIQIAIILKLDFDKFLFQLFRVNGTFRVRHYVRLP